MGRKYKKGETHTDKAGNTYTITNIRPGIDSRYSQITYDRYDKETKTTTRHTTTATKFTRTLNGRKPAMTAAQKNQLLATNIKNKTGITITNEQARSLRLAETTLQRWAEQECGTSNDLHSVSIERDETTNKPFRVVRPHKNNKVIRTPIQDREASALRATKHTAASLGLHFYHQTDPRGASLYVSNEPLNDQNYTDGIVCSV